jgi:hypothetical protein
VTQFGSAFCPVLPDGVADSVGQQFVLAGSGRFLQVIGHPRRDRLARDRFGALAGVEDEQQIRMVVADGLQELDAVLPGHVVVGHDTVVLGLREAIDAIAGAGRRIDLEPLVVLFEIVRGRLRQPSVVVDM